MKKRKTVIMCVVVCLFAMACSEAAAQMPTRRASAITSSGLIWAGGCGDGVIGPDEECDPGLPGLSEPNLGGKTCESEGYSRGELACTAAGRGVGCKLDRSGCTCESGGIPAPVPKTGQTTCWDVWGTPIDCAGTGRDGEYQKGVTASLRFADNNNGTVTDNLTGLIWLKDAICLGEMNWTDALSAANTLSVATAPAACGLTDGSVPGDWRLPNVKEGLSLIDYGQSFPALPPSHPFSSVYQFHLVWSSTARAYTSWQAWVVVVGTGYVMPFDRQMPVSVWPVRGGQ